MEKQMNWHEWLIRKGNPDKSISDNMDDYRKYLDGFDIKRKEHRGKIRTYNHYLINQIKK